MRLLDIVAPVLGLAASAQAWGVTGTGVDTTVYTTVVVSTYTTYCPSPTTFAFHNTTYTVTEPTTITITNCPCTLSVYTPPPVTTTSYGTAPASNQTTIGYFNSTGTYTYTPAPSTELSGTTAITGATTSPTRTPVGPTTTPSSTPTAITVSSAGKVASSIFGGLLAAVAVVAFVL